MRLTIDEVDRLIGRLEALQRQSKPALDRIMHRHNGARGSSSQRDLRSNRGRCTRPCYRQKTFWVGMILISTGVIELSQADNNGASIAHVAQGLGLITLRSAIAKIER